MEDTTQNAGQQGLSRRAVVKGAAWSIPVIAAAAATPMSAASGETIVGTPPTASAVCSPVGEFSVTIQTAAGTPLAGLAVTITLPPGFSWPSGSNPQVRATDANGKVTVIGVTGPSTPGTYQVLASATIDGQTVSTYIPIMIQGTWLVTGPGVGGTAPRLVYTNPTNVDVLGESNCFAFCIEHRYTTRPHKTVGFVESPDAFLGDNNFRHGATLTNYLLPGEPSAALSAEGIQAKVEWVLRHSYPAVSLSALAAAAGITSINEANALEATQNAIWAYTDLAFVDDNWPFEAPAETGRAVFTYLANGAWNDSATAPSDCLKVISSATSECGTPTEANHGQSLAMVCDCDSSEPPCDGTGAIAWGSDFSKTGAATGTGSVVTAAGQTVGFTSVTTFGASLEPYGEHFTAGGSHASGETPLGLMLAAHLKSGAVEAPSAARDQRFSVVTTFTFDKPISDLEFTIWDIDSARTSDGTKLVYREYVFVDGVSRENTTLGNRLQYDSDGWVVSRDWTDILPASPDYAATFKLAGPVQTLTVRMNRPMTTAQRPDSYGAVYLGNVSFTTEC